MSHQALNPEQFQMFKANPKEMGGRPTHTVEAWAPEHVGTDWAKARPEEREHYAGSSADPGHRPMGSISWHHKTGEILGMYVDPAHQRQGVATAMYRHAHSVATETRGVTPPRHSSFRTTSGEAWARSLGERLPKHLQLHGTLGEWQPA
jgi:GNAT superfamily N-acetyltransferase